MHKFLKLNLSTELYNFNPLISIIITKKIYNCYITFIIIYTTLLLLICIMITLYTILLLNRVYSTPFDKFLCNYEIYCEHFIIQV